MNSHCLPARPETGLNPRPRARRGDQGQAWAHPATLVTSLSSKSHPALGSSDLRALVGHVLSPHTPRPTTESQRQETGDPAAITPYQGLTTLQPSASCPSLAEDRSGNTVIQVCPPRGHPNRAKASGDRIWRPPWLLFPLLLIRQGAPQGVRQARSITLGLEGSPVKMAVPGSALASSAHRPPCASGWF